jgi:hypothetical protein
MHEYYLHIKHGNVKVHAFSRPLPRDEGRQYPLRSIKPRHDVRDRDAGPNRKTVRFTCSEYGDVSFSS